MLNFYFVTHTYSTSQIINNTKPHCTLFNHNFAENKLTYMPPSLSWVVKQFTTPNDKRHIKLSLNHCIDMSSCCLFLQVLVTFIVAISKGFAIFSLLTVISFCFLKTFFLYFVTFIIVLTIDYFKVSLYSMSYSFLFFFVTELSPWFLRYFRL